MAGVLEELMVKIGANTKDAEKKIGGFQKFVDGAMDKIAGAGALAGAGLTASFAEAIGQEATSDLMAAQLDLTTAESERAGDVAGDLFANAYGQSFGEVNEALRGVIAQTGELGDISDAELSGLGANALDLAKILGTDVVRVTQVAGQAVKHGLADNMEDAFDLIAAASQETMPGLQEDLLDAADEYAKFFADIGLDGERAFGILATASQDGMHGIDKAGDAVKEFTIRATDMSTTSVAAFDLIGLDAQTMANDLLAGGDTAAGAFDTIVSGLLGIEDPADRANAAIALFGTPLEDLSVTEIPTFLSALTDAGGGLGDVAGAADDAGATLNDNASTGLLTFARTLRTDVIANLEPLLPMLTGLAAFLTPLTPLLLGIAAALGLIGIGLAIYKAALIIATVAQWLFNAALWANPITWIIIAIIALIAIVVLMVMYWDQIVAALGVAWAWIKQGASDLASWVVDAFWSIVDGVASGLSSMVGWIGDKWAAGVALVRAAIAAIGGFLSGMWDGITQGLKSALNGAIGLINSAIGGINTLISGANQVPGVSIPSIPKIPMLADGGIVTGPTLAMIGEGANDEAVVPLPRGARSLTEGGGQTDIYLHLESDDEDLLRRIRRTVQVRGGGNVQLVFGSGRV
jgi:phage-related minor tail protein